MIPRVDYLSYTRENPARATTNYPHAYNDILGHAIGSSPDPIAAIIAAADFQPKGGKNFYKHWLHGKGMGVDLFWSPNRPEYLVQLSGIGCAHITDDDLMASAVGDLAPDCTRIDLTADFETDILPQEFIWRHGNKRFTADSHQNSESGTTWYLGSWTSAKFAKVYRWKDPHPRAKYLRVEHVYRYDQAQPAAESVPTLGIEDAVIAAGNSFGWEHPVWKESQRHDMALKTWQPERGQGETIRWHLTSTFPNLRKLHDSGVIPDLHAFVQQYLFEDQQDENIH